VLTFLALLDPTPADSGRIRKRPEVSDPTRDETSSAVGPAPISAPPTTLARPA
jgi:hypothetical protein